LDLVLVAKITSPHGIGGMVKLQAFTADPKDLSDLSPLLSKDGRRTFAITSLRANANAVIAQIEGSNDRNAAELLRGTELYISRDKLPELKSDRYYLDELIGMEVVSEAGSPFGSVIGVHNFGAGNILEIRSAAGEAEMFTFTSANFPMIDKQKRVITIIPPEVLE